MWKLSTIGIAAMALTLYVIVKVQADQINNLKESNAAYALELDKAIAINQGQNTVIRELTEARKRDSEAIIYKDGLINELSKELEAKRQEIAQAAQFDPEYRDWQPNFVPALADRLLSNSAASDGANGINPSHTTTGFDGAMPSPGLERQN